MSLAHFHNYTVRMESIESKFEIDLSMFTDKMIRFVENSMEHKPVTDVPGIGEKIGDWLKKTERITKARQLQKYYDKNSEQDFKDLIKRCHGKIQDQKRAYYAMRFWDVYPAWRKLPDYVVRYRGLSPASYNTKKMKEFLEEPMDDKLVQDVPGIGRSIGTELNKDAEIKTALDLYTFYCRNSEEKFKAKIKSCGGDRRWREVAYSAMWLWENLRIFSRWQEVTYDVYYKSKQRNLTKLHYEMVLIKWAEELVAMSRVLGH